jgi:hypothetical protein
MLKFLRSKLQGYSFSALIYTQLEPCLFWLINGLPAFPGFFLSHLLCKFLL